MNKNECGALKFSTQIITRYSTNYWISDREPVSTTAVTRLVKCSRTPTAPPTTIRQTNLDVYTVENYRFEIRNGKSINRLRPKPSTRKTLQDTNKQTATLLTTTSIDLLAGRFYSSRLESRPVCVRLIIKNNQGNRRGVTLSFRPDDIGGTRRHNRLRTASVSVFCRRSG